MRTLIYATAFSGRHRSWCQLWHESVRRHYEGDMLIITDDPDHIRAGKIGVNHPRTKLVHIKDLHKRPEYTLARLTIGPMAIELEKYDLIMYTDVDTVMMHSPEPMFKFIEQNSHSAPIIYTREPIPITSRWHGSVLRLEGYVPDDKSRLGINTGFWICKAEEFLKLADLWFKAYQYYCCLLNDLNDQPVFNWLVETNKIKALEAPQHFQFFPEYMKRKCPLKDYEHRKKEKNIIWHFTGINDRKVWEAMRKALGYET